MLKITLLSFILVISGCSYFEDKEDPTTTWTAERLYAEAKGELDSGNFSKAVEYYEKLETRFPFGVYGQQSLLDLAYAYYKTDATNSALSAAERFIKLYPQTDHPSP